MSKEVSSRFHFFRFDISQAMSLSFRQADGSDSPRLPLDLALLISDSLEAPATFLLVQQLSLALKAKRRCIVVGVANSFDYYAALLRKQVCESNKP